MRYAIYSIGVLLLLPVLLLAQSGSAAGAGADMLERIRERNAATTPRPTRDAAPMPGLQPLTYRVVDGKLAKSINSYCATLWMDDEEVLVIDYGTHTFMMRTGFGDIGRACRTR